MLIFELRKRCISAFLIGWLFFFAFSCQKAPVLSSTDSKQSITPVSVQKPDVEVDQMITPYKQQLDEKMNRVIGYCPTELTKQDHQSTLGNFVIDLILEQSEKHFGKDIDMAVVTNGGLRTPIPQGNITVGNIFELMPFNNEIVILELKGESVVKMMGYAALKGNAVFAGVKYKVKYGQPEDIYINGKPFDYDATYTLAVSDYLAGGGDKMDFLTEAVKTHQIGVLFRNAIIDHIEELTAAGKQIEGQLDERVVIEN